MLMSILATQGILVGAIAPGLVLALSVLVRPCLMVADLPKIRVFRLFG